MADKDSGIPEVFKIKGYKYRAKMLIVGTVILIVFIIILSSIIHGIASAIKGASAKNSDTDINSDTDVSSVVSDMSEDTDTETIAAPVSVSQAAAKEEKFDADGRLVIDTDTLDGKKAIAITFDDGPGEYTQELIQGLNERGAHATFFMVGSCVEKYPEVVSMMAAGGHQLGNHTYDHINISSAGLEAANASIAKTDEAIIGACGQKSTAFRPPYGSYTNDIAKSIDKTFTIWSLDTVDWKTKDMGQIKNTIVSQSRDGSIVLLHDLYKTSVDAALAAIDELKGEGFVFVTVDELMTRYGYAVSPGPHSAQYAVYETNSPHAKEYAADKERDKEKNVSSQSEGSFYFDRQTDSDEQTDSEYTEKYENAENDGNNDSSPYTVIETQSDPEKLIY